MGDLSFLISRDQLHRLHRKEARDDDGDGDDGDAGGKEKFWDKEELY